jgi:hypothetical protein
VGRSQSYAFEGPVRGPDAQNMLTGIYKVVRLLL